MQSKSVVERLLRTAAHAQNGPELKVFLQVSLLTRGEVEDWDVILYFREWTVEHHFVTLRVSDGAGEPRIDPLVRCSGIEQKRCLAKMRV